MAQELKAYAIRAIDGLVVESESGQLYLKSEADKVIAELEQKLQDHCTTCPVKEQEDDVVSELKEERRWRKCSEELPEDGAEVLATDGDGIWLCYKTTMCDGSPWFQPDGLPQIEGVTHWMPRPKAPKEAK